MGVAPQVVKVNELTIEVREHNLELSGSADREAIEPLRKLVEQIHASAVRSGKREVGIDMRKLEFMNASCVTVFVTWLAQIGELDTDAQFKLRFKANALVSWQRSSVRALACYATKLVAVDFA